MNHGTIMPFTPVPGAAAVAGTLGSAGLRS